MKFIRKTFDVTSRQEHRLALYFNKQRTQITFLTSPPSILAVIKLHTMPKLEDITSIQCCFVLDKTGTFLTTAFIF